ncbi:MAG: hypothetical protein SNJ56_00405 [Termitinemataceae bacterium]
MEPMSILDLQAELLRTEFPYLTPDHDPDIERYYDLRALGRSQDALVLYQTRLVLRYPNEHLRTSILRAYRTRSPLFPQLLQQAYRMLGQHLLERTKKILKYISIKADSYDETDVYSTIKAAESILAILPRDRYEAVMAMERYSRYARILHYCEASVAKAEALIRAYVTETLSVVEEERKRRAAAKMQAEQAERRRLLAQDKADMVQQRERREQLERERLSRGTSKQLGPARADVGATRRLPEVHIDLNAIRFSAADVARIQIPPTLTKVEDKTLAFCFKYWNLIYDEAFERVLFLYSKKYASQHYEIFSIIKRGRLGGKRDEEILAAIMSQLITGYYYSIQGDRYLQQQWALLKKRLEGKPVQGSGQEKQSTRPRRGRVHPRSTVGRQTGVLERPRLSETPQARSGESIAAGQGFRTTQGPQGDQDSHNTAGGHVSEPHKETGSRVPRQEVASSQGQPLAVPPLRRYSVSERLMQLSGRTYDVYEDIFFAHLRPAIRRVLSTGKGLFFTVPQDAENLIFQYLRDNYHNPYMNWETSAERQSLAQMGFALPSIDPIIDACYLVISKK